MSDTAESPRRLIAWTIAALALAVVLVWLLYLVRDVLLWIYVSALFAIGLSPVVRLIERQRRLRLPRWLAILAVYLVILAALTGVGFVVLPPLVRQARQFAADLPRLTEQAQQYLLGRGF
ncbi:MAG: AI-2E family transporter [Candidatus Rokubacteria bacterium]|nr:AI-2E family transporter [Candidatus Rokubacteria bacterium]